MTILFVCTGNICRSAFAERLTVHWRGTELPVSSAGTHARPGAAMHPLTEDALNEHGGSGAGYRATTLTAEVLAPAELVLTMTRRHRERVLELSPRHLHHTFTLLEAADLAARSGSPRVSDVPGLRTVLRAARARRGAPTGSRSDDIPDPIEGSAAMHRSVGAQIADALAAVLDLVSEPATQETRPIRSRPGGFTRPAVPPPTTRPRRESPGHTR